MKKSFDRVQNDDEAVAELDKPNVETLTRISNFRGAQIEILPSHKERGVFAKLFCTSQGKEILNQVQNDNYVDLAVCHSRKLDDMKKSKTSRKKAAFTLAEVLIAIGIIGVVAAITIPNLIQKNYEKQVVSKLQSTQAILIQAIKMAEEENGELETWINPDMTNAQRANAIAVNIKPFLKIAVDCGVGRKRGVCLVDSPYTRLNNELHDNYNNTNMHYAVKLLNGSTVCWRGYVGTNENPIKAAFFIDVNGVALPNTFGRDWFTFYYFNNVLVPAGFPGTGQDKSCTLKSTGYGCAYVVLKNKNMNYLHVK
jgi:prepilin-type N-terminal cleavage/methylation domain-containing protein